MNTAQPTRLCVVGSLNADLVFRAERLPAPGETLLGELSTAAGGKGANQAGAAARAGAMATMIGAVGDDEHGRFVLAQLAAAGVDTRLVFVRAGAATGAALITLGAQSSQNTIVVAPGANSALSVADIAHPDVHRAISDADVLVLQLEIPVETAIAAAGLARERGTTVILNAAPARRLPWELLGVVDVLIVNAAEAGVVLGQAPLEDAAVTDDDVEDLRRLGVSAAVVTLGAKGAAWVTPHSHGRVAAYPVEVIDTVGAGDAFCGCFATRWAEHQAGSVIDDAAINDAVCWGCAAGAVAASRTGALAAMPARAEVVRMLCRRG